MVFRAVILLQVITYVEESKTTKNPRANLYIITYILIFFKGLLKINSPRPNDSSISETEIPNS